MPELKEVRLLLVDDDHEIRRAYGNALGRDGFRVEIASSGADAIERLKIGSFDVIVSDISMPRMTGLEFLRAVRARDVEVPVILMTGEPDIDSAILAVEYGAFRYLSKPIEGAVLAETARRAATLHKLAKLKREALELTGPGSQQLGERAALEVNFSNGLERMWMAYQPIVDWRERRIFGFEALLRSDEPLMKNPAEMLDAAERLGRVHDLGRAVRGHVARAASEAPSGAKLFVNLHSADLNDDQLFEATSPLSSIASRVVLEVTERASLLDVKNVMDRTAKLKAMGFRIAIDDLGAGYAGLSSFTQLEPEVAKLDMSLIRGIDTDARRQSIVRSMRTLCEELGILVVSEGVETAAERDTLVGLGCNLFQGYLFARPGRGFAALQF